jgi:hypothetical protein
MTPRIFCLIAAVVFSLISLSHFLRLLFGWHVTVERVVMPMWISWIGLAVGRHISCLPGLPGEQVVDEATSQSFGTKALLNTQRTKLFVKCQVFARNLPAHIRPH